MNTLSNIINLNYIKAINLLKDEELLSKIEKNQRKLIMDFLLKNSRIDIELIEESFANTIIEKENDIPIQPKQNSDQIKKDHEEKISEIIMNLGLVVDELEKVFNQKGENIPVILTAFGPAKVAKTVEIDGVAIAIENIPKKNNFA
ncbi:hypothetical protein [Leptospira interrogans]|uniref:hypothetical protein n=2 Tax=Leptospira interrogans TaxID=173 RepID=UPI0002BC0A28|nr:hypothetical protein [Leptospira interrogans]